MDDVYNNNKQKKPFYKKWWIWAILILLAGFGGVLGEYGNSTDNETGSEQDNTQAEEIVLDAGTYTVGSDITPGRYKITSEGTGNLFVNNGAKINEVLTDIKSVNELGVSSVTLDLVDGDIVKLSKVKKAYFIPADTVKSDTLSAGYWLVGSDIDEGKYTVSCAEGEYGTISVYDDTEKIVDEILDNADLGVGDKSVRVTLKKGQTVHIQGINEAVFE